jgi:hypothetical protein
VSSRAVFGTSVILGFVVWGVVTWRYIWPELRRRPLTDALHPILLMHSFRFIGLAFLVPGVVSPDLPIEFARPAAYGDLATGIVALLALATLPSRLGMILVWAFNLLGSADLLNAFYQGNRTQLDPGLQGSMYFVPTVWVPLLLITHGLVFRLLLRGNPGVEFARRVVERSE